MLAVEEFLLRSAFTDFPTPPSSSSAKELSAFTAFPATLLPFFD
jgi:hypothetical protein